MGDWQQVGENLVRHRGGKIYLRAKVAGKVIRQSLETSDLRIAKMKRDDKLLALRTAAVKAEPLKVRTLGDAVNLAADRDLGQPHLEEATVEYYTDLYAILRKTMPVEVLARTWTIKEATGWWRGIAKHYAPQRANNLLSAARRVTAVIMESGQRVNDPLEGLKRMKIPKRNHQVPSMEVMEMVISSIAEQGKRASRESANYVAFLAFSGCRHGEAAALTWENVGADRVTITGGDDGTKNDEFRVIPMSSRLKAVIDSMRHEGASGPLFSIRTPRLALDNACKRLGISHLRLHDLRHFFATHAVEKGVDVAVVSKWLGHKDGGVLVLKTYGHARDEHSFKSAEKL